MKTPKDIQRDILNIATELEATASKLTFGQMTIGDGTARVAALADALRGYAPDIARLAPAPAAIVW